MNRKYNKSTHTAKNAANNNITESEAHGVP